MRVPLKSLVASLQSECIYAFIFGLTLILSLSVGCSNGAFRYSCYRSDTKVAGLVLVPVISATHPENEPCVLKLILMNKSHASVEIGIKSPYSDCGLYVYDGNGKPCQMTEFGRIALDSRVIAATDRSMRLVPSPSVDSPKMDRLKTEDFAPVFTGRSWITTRIPTHSTGPFLNQLGTANSLFKEYIYPSATWVVDLNKVFILKPGKYTITANYKYSGADGTVELQSSKQHFSIVSR